MKDQHPFQNEKALKWGCCVKGLALEWVRAVSYSMLGRSSPAWGEIAFELRGPHTNQIHTPAPQVHRAGVSIVGLGRQGCIGQHPFRGLVAPFLPGVCEPVPPQNPSEASSLGQAALKWD